MFYPHDKSDIKLFTPDAFEHLEKPPVYYLRAGAYRDKIQFQRLVIEENAQSHSQDDIRDEILNGLKELGNDEDYAEWEPRIKAYWEAADSFGEEVKAIRKEADQDTPAEMPAFVYDDEEAVLKVIRSIEDNWRDLRKMNADNLMAGRIQAVIMTQIILTKVDGSKVGINREGKYLSYETAGELREELQTFARLNDVDANVALRELDREILTRLFVPKSAEKNFNSPSPSSSDQNSSKTGTAAESGTSTASESSTETPAAS